MPYRRYLLGSLRAGLSAIAMLVMATAMTACSNSQAEAPPSPPPEVDAVQVVTKSVRQWDAQLRGTLFNLVSIARGTKAGLNAKHETITLCSPFAGEEFRNSCFDLTWTK